MLSRILILDNKEVFHRLIIQHFRKEIANKEYEFVSAFSDSEALKKIKLDYQIDLMLFNVDINGFALLEELNKQNIKLKTIIFSDKEDKEKYRKAMELRAYGFLVKPINATALAKTINRVLQADKPTSKAQLSPPQISNAKSINNNTDGNNNITERKPHTNRLLKMVKELPTPQRLKMIFQLIETIESFEDLEDIGYKVETQIQVAADNEAEREELLVENQKREMRGEKPLIILENGWVELRYMTKTLVGGEKRRYGPYYYMRWRENGKLKSKCLGKEDPSSLLTGSNIRVYEIDVDSTNKSSLEKETVQEKRLEPKKFRLDLDKNAIDVSR